MTTTTTITLKIDRKSGCWAKRITSVDPSLRGGFALSGEFLNEGENALPVGAVVVEVDRDGDACLSLVGPHGLIRERHAATTAKPWLRGQRVWRSVRAETQSLCAAVASLMATTPEDLAARTLEDARAAANPSVSAEAIRIIEATAAAPADAGIDAAEQLLRTIRHAAESGLGWSGSPADVATLWAILRAA